MHPAAWIIIIANIIDLAASLIQFWTGILKEKQRILFWQCVMFAMQTVSMSLLGGYSAAVSNVLSIVRNVLCYYDKAGKAVKAALIGAQFVLTLFVGGGTVIGWMPFVVCTIFIIFMDEKDPIRFKLLSAATFAPWIVYFLIYKSYTGAFFAVITTIANIVTLSRMIKAKKAA